MTQNRRFKKRVRARMAETGESYSAAYQLLRNITMEETPMTDSFQLVHNQDFGFSLELPSSWRDVGPDIYNSTFEVARYLRTPNKIHDGIVNVFWDIPGESLRSLVEVGNSTPWDLNLKDLREEGITEVSTEELELGGRHAIRLDWATSFQDIEDWASRSYFMEVRGKYVCLNMGTSNRAQDAELYDRVAKSFDAIEKAVGIVLVRKSDTPSEFVAKVLEKVFAYTERRALQQSVRMNTINEAVVALVPENKTIEILKTVEELSRASGYGLTARTAS